VVFKKEKGSGKLIRWRANCNYYGTKVHLDGDRLRPVEVGGTLMGCPRPWLREDKWLALFMEAGPRFHFSGGRLVLSVGGKKIELREKNA
jgi:heat shock protein HslJ